MGQGRHRRGGLDRHHAAQLFGFPAAGLQLPGSGRDRDFDAVHPDSTVLGDGRRVDAARHPD